MSNLIDILSGYCKVIKINRNVSYWAGLGIIKGIELEIIKNDSVGVIVGIRGRLGYRLALGRGICGEIEVL